jgi:2-succinyl-5-enolpyruvyl-6-hydroxy-3-cyclohexene-1-carboxylate synthase
LFHNDFEPEVVIQIGEPPISGALDRFVALHPNLVRHVLTEHGWPDPHGTARSIVVGNIDKTLKSIGDRLEERSISPDPAWSAALSGANDAAWRAVESVLADEPQLSEGAAIRAVVDALPPGAALSLGNSLPVRHADAFLRQKSTGVTVLGQRGASGIDGVLSATAGAARATGRPTALVNGDVSTLHDLGGFAVAKTVASPLVVVVLNNDGGRIFEQLPWGSSEIEDDKAKFWTTPHGYDFRAVADLFGLRYARPETARALSEAVAGAMATPGCTLIEVVLPVHGARELYAKVGASVDRELRAAATR